MSVAAFQSAEAGLFIGAGDGDGGVANNTPISTAIGLAATRVIVLATGFACALSLLVTRPLVQDAARLAGGAVELRIVPSLCPPECSPYNHSAGATLFARARASTLQWLEGGGLERAVIPAQLHEHQH